MDNKEYLEPGFDPKSLTVANLRSILLEHDIIYPSSAKKSDLVELFKDQVTPNAAKFLADYDRLNVPNGHGIINMDSPNSNGKASKKSSSVSTPASEKKRSRHGNDNEDEDRSDHEINRSRELSPSREKKEEGSLKKEKKKKKGTDDDTEKSPFSSDNVFQKSFSVNSSSPSPVKADKIIPQKRELQDEKTPKKKKQLRKKTPDIIQDVSTSTDSSPNNLKHSPIKTLNVDKYEEKLQFEDESLDIITNSIKSPKKTKLKNSQIIKPEKEIYVSIAPPRNSQRQETSVKPNYSPKPKSSSKMVIQNNLPDILNSTARSPLGPKKILSFSDETVVPEEATKEEEIPIEHEHVEPPASSVLIDDSEEKPTESQQELETEAVGEDALMIEEEFIIIEKDEILSEDVNKKSLVSSILSSLTKLFTYSLSTILIFFLISTAIFYRQLKINTGYCGSEVNVSLNLVESFQLRDNFPSIVPYVDMYEKFLEDHKPACVECPKHAICKPYSHITCNVDYIRSTNWLGLFGLIPGQEYCVPDVWKMQRIKSMARYTLRILKDKRDKTISMDELHDLLYALRSDGISAEEFEQNWLLALEDLEKNPMVKVNYQFKEITIENKIIENYSSNTIINKRKKAKLFDQRPAPETTFSGKKDYQDTQFSSINVPF
ncbi:hypothetical protein BVG19_g2205 [[Candida] boidinii]|nr:hypothetical protein BVG19_g2205 [[Candida] boidinii]OWB50720.1 hypothetical protein B5S27_g2272 [[Candida] boidinii]OWB83001.1 hypothetical protein B5S33_g1630 [[Candida] boidinii]